MCDKTLQAAPHVLPPATDAKVAALCPIDYEQAQSKIAKMIKVIDALSEVIERLTAHCGVLEIKIKRMQEELERVNIATDAAIATTTTTTTTTTRVKDQWKGEPGK